jgi:hypothetical protein
MKNTLSPPRLQLISDGDEIDIEAKGFRPALCNRSVRHAQCPLWVSGQAIAGQNLGLQVHAIYCEGLVTIAPKPEDKKR